MEAFLSQFVWINAIIYSLGLIDINELDIEHFNRGSIIMIYVGSLNDSYVKVFFGIATNFSL